ncbi:MAG: hypothetical protein FJY29_06205 [Betaproteobacteria bacterium]|nr:hypothetical protein [Betaproteobacteria bacterium]
MSSTTDNRLLAGIDIFVEAPFSVQLPKQIGTMKLEHIASRGTKLKGSELEKRILDVHWLCARYVFEGQRPLNTETEANILQVIQSIGSQYKWSSVIKLYTLDGKPQYS